MHPTLAIGHALLRVGCAGLLLATAIPAAQANWLSRLSRIGTEVGEVAPKAGRLGVVELEGAATYVRSLPGTGNGAALAAHATPEGHWKFVNRDGDVFTAGTPEELQRVVPMLLPETAPGAKLGIYLSEETLFRERSLLKELPPAATLYVVVGKEGYPLIVRTSSAGDMLYAAVRPNLHVELREQGLFGEAVTRLERPLSRSSIRTLALEPGAPQTLSSYPRIDPDSKAALVDALDPAALAGTLSSVRGQTVLVTGRVDGNLLYFQPSRGSEQSLKLSDLMRAAADNDVNLVILHAATPRQPGGTNWLWQRISVGGLDDALKRATLGDFLDALGAGRGEFRVSVTREGSGRVAIRAVPLNSDSGAITGMVGDLWTNTVSSLTGNVVTSAIEVHARGEERQQELDRRIVPYVPSWIQIAYLVSLVAGMLGWPVASSWFACIWPPERRGEYASGLGYRAAQAARLVAFVVVFLPLVGAPAFIGSLILQAWGIAMLPVRAVRWLAARREAETG
ncbi:MAG: hypothetical protein WC829_19000 [Hyphomicrobium sp.]|jgi:hypothetical protein